MNAVAFLLLLIAIVVFGIAVVVVPRRANLIALGLALFAAAVLVQQVWGGNSVHA